MRQCECVRLLCATRSGSHRAGRRKHLLPLRSDLAPPNSPGPCVKVDIQISTSQLKSALLRKASTLHNRGSVVTKERAVRGGLAAGFASWTLALLMFYS